MAEVHVNEGETMHVFNHVFKALGRLTAIMALTAMLVVVAPAVFPTHSASAAAGETVTARVNVNIRSGPGTRHAKLGVLRAGATLKARGTASNGWVPVTHQGRQAWVSAAHVQLGGTATAPVASGSTGQAFTTTKLNVRATPSTSRRALGVLAKGAAVAMTGARSGSWTQITWRGGTAWVASRYLTTTAQASTPTPAPPPAATPAPSPAPSTVGSRWATTELNLWLAASGSSYNGTVPKGTELQITGTVQRGRAQVVWRGATRWVSAKYLSESAPGTTPSGSSTCKASFYSDDTATASGERFDQWALKTAHKTLPFGTRLKVTNPANGKSVVVTVNDRGPYVAGRCLDLTTGAFSQIASTRQGVVTVTYEVLR
ncbi:MAG: septal ring lytic transglycosylase RlpA family protein [Propionibacteriaceae bacterium]|nr:septal ring lytic transglycosylase RlpA family protein [Propionibacteriaceae bacterium]